MDADLDVADQWRSNVMPELLQQYVPRDVYNADETCIYFRAVPDGTLSFSTDRLSGRKKAKERVTALVCANMDWSKGLQSNGTYYEGWVNNLDKLLYHMQSNCDLLWYT